MMLSLLMRRAFSAAMIYPSYDMYVKVAVLFFFGHRHRVFKHSRKRGVMFRFVCPNADSRITMAFFASGERIYPSYVSKFIDIPPFFNLSGTGVKRLSGPLIYFLPVCPMKGRAASACLLGSADRYIPDRTEGSLFSRNPCQSGNKVCSHK